MGEPGHSLCGWGTGRGFGDGEPGPGLGPVVGLDEAESGSMAWWKGHGWGHSARTGFEREPQLCCSLPALECDASSLQASLALSV